MAQEGQDNQGFPQLDRKAARALAPNIRTIQIQSILGGIAPMNNFYTADQYSDANGIDPFLPPTDIGNGLSTGLLRPSNLGALSSFGIGTNSDFTAVHWLVPEPKGGNVYAYHSSGSTFSMTQNSLAVTALSDGGSMSSSTGNGAEYYDNYMYFAKNTDIARYGPLNGAPSFDATYWTSTLGKAALTNTSYPSTTYWTNMRFPNHFMHRHSDGKLYIADVVGNQGTIHFISTTKTAIEGDTDNGSTANKLQFGYGLWPTAIESYGSQIVVALYEGTSNTATSSVFSRAAKLAFWDTTSQSFNSITWTEFPDPLITGLKNIDGTLYIISGNNLGFGFRVSRYVGGTSFEDVYINNYHTLPFPGGIDGEQNRIIFASNATAGGPNVYSLGFGVPGTKKGLHALGGNSSGDINSFGTAVLLTNGVNTQIYRQIVLGYSSGNLKSGITTTPSSAGAADYSLYTRTWTSQVYKIGQPFKITKIRFPLAQAMAANMIVTPVITTDEGAGPTYTGGTSNGLAIMNNTNYPGKRNIVMRPESATGDHSFQLKLQWTGSALCTVAFPITIEYEIIPD